MRAAALALVLVTLGTRAGAAAAAPAPPAAAPPAPEAAQAITVQGRRQTEADERRQSVVGLTVLGREELDAHGDLSVLDVLARVAGVDIDGDQPRLRGLGGGYTQILINGEPAPPGFAMDQLSPGDIERIEVVKGPTAEHGGAAGTINIILRRAARLRQTEWRAALGWRAVAPQGSTSVSHSDRFGAVGLHLPLSLFTWANGQQQATERDSRDADGMRTLRRTQQQDRWLGAGLQFAPRLDWAWRDDATLQWQALVQANRSRNAGERDTEVLAGTPPDTPRWAWRSRGEWALQRYQWQWVKRFDGGGRLELKAALQLTRSEGEGRASGFGPGDAVTVQRESRHLQRGRQQSQGGRWRWPLGEQHTLTGGWDLERRHHDERRDQVDNGVPLLTGSLGVPFAALRQRGVLFVQHDWAPSPQWAVSAAVRGEAVDVATEGPPGRVRQRHDAVLPLLHLRHALDATGREVLRASVSARQRAPDLGLLLPRYSLDGTYPREERNTPVAADSAGNPLLRPERVHGLELAWERSGADGSVLSAGFFHREVRDLIRRRIALEAVAEAPVPRWVSRPVNLGRAHSSGLELEWRHRFPDAAPGGAARRPAPGATAGEPAAGTTWRAALSLYRSRVEQTDDPDARLEGQPPWRLTAGAERQWTGGRAAGFTLLHTPAFSTQQSDLQRLWRGAQTRLDAYASWRQPGVGQWRLAVVNALAPAARRPLGGHLPALAAQRRRYRPVRRRGPVVLHETGP
ncbi:MAG: TonB-dependent receptor plug domain-containing protein, partial [Betaproteobacteria bacterium]